jgi:hypothetical protein
VRHVVGAGAFDDLGVLEQVGQVGDAALHVTLRLLGGVVVAVLREVAQLTGSFDLPGDLDPPARRQVVVLAPEALVRGRR